MRLHVLQLMKQLPHVDVQHLQLLLQLEHGECVLVECNCYCGEYNVYEQYTFEHTVFKSVYLDPLLTVLLRKPALDHNGHIMSRVVYPLILGPIRSSNGSTVNPDMLEHSSIACRLLYGLATRLSNLGIRTFLDLVHFF